MCSTAKERLVLLSIFILFLVKISVNSYIKMRLLDKHNEVRYLVLFPGEKNTLSAFCLK